MAIFINEFHYDNAGTDTGEFVEIAGPAGTNLSGYSLALYNGNPSQLGAAPTIINLSGTIPNLGNGYGVLSFATSGLQNGGAGIATEPDGIALTGPGNTVIEFISYEGSFTPTAGPAAGIASTNVGSGVGEPGDANGTSIARRGSGTEGSSFTWAVDTNDTPGQVNNSQTLGTSETTQVTIGDVALAEGDSGTKQFSFSVTRSDNSGAFTVDFATAAGTATAGSDFASANGTLTFAAGGALTQQIVVDVTGDTASEPNETFAVNLSNLVNGSGTATISDATGTGTITNDDVSVTRIHTIQGASHTSSFVGQVLTTTGIVTAVDSNGFYLQEKDSLVDGNDATSEAIFVFTSSAPTVAVGHEVNVTGRVAEFIPGGASTGNLSTTQIDQVSAVATLSTGNALPTAILLGVGGRQAPTEVIDDDQLATFDPANDGIDFFESLEGMLVTVPTPRAVSPTNSFGEIYTVADNGANATNLSSRGTIVTEGSVGDGLAVTNTGPGSDYNPERIQIDADSTITPGGMPNVNVGAVLNNVTGVIGYNFGNYEVIPTSAITVATPSTLTAETTALVGDEDTLTVAAYNVLNLDPNDSDGDTDVADGRFTLIATQIVQNLGAPDIIALQEIQDNSGAADNGIVSASVTLQMLVDAINAQGGPTYSFIDNPYVVDGGVGGEPGGNIRVAYLYRDDRVDLVEGSLITTPDAATAFAGSRAPLIATFEFNGEEVTIVNNHFSSKGGSTPLFGATQPSLNGSADERLVQAQSVADYVDSLADDAKVIVLGDLNEFTNEESLAPLTEAGLSAMSLTLTTDERYSYIFDGNAQELDQAYMSASVAAASQFDILHTNAEFAYSDASASDHDPSVIALTVEDPVFTLQLLHLSDGEAGLLAGDTAKFLAAMVDAYEDDYANSITLSGGDTYLPGPFLAAGTDPSLIPIINATTGSTIPTTPGTTPAPGVVDTAIHNIIGVEASGIGNHEWDLGSNVYAATLAPGGGWVGAQYASISANLVLSPPGQPADPLAGRFTQTVGVNGLEEASTLKGRVAPSAVITEGGETIGLVGLTTQILESISSPSGAEILGFPYGPGPNGETNDMALLAAQLQPVIDDLRAQGVNKIILMSHLQQIQFEIALAPLLQGVDIILAAGSNTRLGDADDEAVAFPGHAADFADTYPIVTAGADGATTFIVNTDNEYTYLGRLVVDFDENGEIILDSLSENLSINGAYASTAENAAEAWGVAEADLETTAFADGTRGDRVRDLTEAVGAVIAAKDGNIYGYTDVYLEGERVQVRNQETNLGNVSADANADAARDALGLGNDAVVVSIKNGGGIRAQIGTIVNNPDGTVTKVPPEAGGEVSQLDVENALRFDNKLMVFDTTPQGLLNILNSPNALAPNNGGFIQIGGVQFSYDPTKPAGQRVQDVVLVDGQGNKVAAIANNGVVVAGAPSLIQVVSLNFTANGGDGYLVKANASNFRYLLNDGTLSAPIDEALDFTAPANVPANALGELQAFADYFEERFGTPETAFDEVDTSKTLDQRIQNQAVRNDTVLEGETHEGTTRKDMLVGEGLNDVLLGLEGQDTLNGNGGDDTLDGGDGKDFMRGGDGNDTYYVDRVGDEVVEAAGNGIDTIISTAALELANHVENGTLTGSAGVRLFGQQLANVLTGNDGDNRIEGFAGDDYILGGLGDDIIVGGAGRDTLAGGSDADRFDYERLAETGVGAVRDIISDFEAGLDTIHLGNIDANSAKGGNQAFKFIGNAAFGNTAGQLRTYAEGGNTIVAGDVNGDGAADFEIQLTGVVPLTAADFAL